MKSSMTFLLLTVLIPVTLSLECFLCDSTSTEYCNAEFGELVTCKVDEDLCIKVETVNPDGDHSYMRRCMKSQDLNPVSKNMCVYNQGFDGSYTYTCICDQNRCNNSGSVFASMVAIVAAIAVTVFTSF